MQSTLDARLASAAGYVRQGAVFADIGTDHAYLPIYLLQNGKISSAIAADIAKGPLSKAMENAKDFGLQDKISFFLTDGLSGLSSLSVTDIAICGMGGEMIASIIENAPFVKDKSIRLILQPMSKSEILRGYLFENGFCILEEKLCSVGSHTYSCICAEYDEKKREPSLFSLYVGKPKIENEEDARNFLRLLSKKEKALQKRMSGLLTANKDAEKEKELLLEISKEKEKIYESFRII